MLQSTIETSRYTLIIATSLVPGFLVLSLGIYNMKQVDVLLPRPHNCSDGTNTPLPAYSP